MRTHARAQKSLFDGDGTFALQFVVAYNSRLVYLHCEQFGFFVEVLDLDVDQDMHSARSALA